MKPWGFDLIIINIVVFVINLMVQNQRKKAYIYKANKNTSETLIQNAYDLDFGKDESQYQNNLPNYIDLLLFR